MAKTAAERSREYRLRNGDEVRRKSREHMRRRREEDPEGEKQKLAVWRQKNAAKDKATRRAWQLRTRYGMTVEQFDEMLAAQDARCKICRSEDPKGHGRWHVDHCHTTGKVRGILCSDCNTALGLVCDSPTTLVRAAHYLREAA